MCDSPIRDTPARAADKKQHGPHAGLTIIVRVSPEARGAFDRSEPMPVGAVVVKEKYGYASGPLVAYALMIKREPGYDPENGDWQYAYVSLSRPDKTVTEGRLKSCIDCHAGAKAKDYLFRSYLEKK
jgi:hypothetical protein